jgi:predicted DNA-binding transcriptional regulator AlpA
MSATPLTLADRIPMLCTVTDVCRLLQISQPRFYQLLKAQRFPFAEVRPRIAGGPRFRGADVRNYIDGHFAEQRSA